MDGGDVFGEVAFLSEAFVTHCARKGGGIGGVDGGDVSGEVRFPCAA